MKNLFKSFVAVTAAAMAFVGCVKEQPLAPQNNEDTISLTIIADAQPENLTKTQMEGDDVIWSSNEWTNFYTDGLFLSRTSKGQKDPNYNVVITPDHKLQATLHTIPTGTQYIDGFFGAKYSYDAQIKDNTTNEVSAFGITLPSVQNVTTSTFDPLADVLVMDRIDITGVDLKQPIAYATYHRLNAITKLSFKGLDAYASENVSSVEFTTTNADLAGEFTYDYVAKKFVTTSGTETTGSIFNFNASKSVTMNFPSNTKLDANFAAWMVTAAQTLKAGEVITVTISTDKHNFTASFKAPGDKVFTNTQLNTLVLNMSKATISEDLQLVADGDYVIAFKDNTKYFAMNTDYQKANERLNFQEVPYTSGEKLVVDAKCLWHVAAVNSTENTYAISNGDNSLKAGKSQAKLVKTSSPLPSECVFTISKGAAESFVIAANVNSEVRTLKKNGTYGFGFYSGTNEVYLIPASENPVPKITFDATTFTVAQDATTLKVPFTRNKFATGNVTVSATSEGNWLTVKPTTIVGSVSEITCSFEANTSAERTATLTISHDGMTNQTITVKQSAYVAPGTTKQYTMVIKSSDLHQYSTSGSGYDQYTGIQTFTAKASDQSSIQVDVNVAKIMVGDKNVIQMKKREGSITSNTNLGKIISITVDPNQNVTVSYNKPTAGEFSLKCGTSNAYVKTITIVFEK